MYRLTTDWVVHNMSTCSQSKLFELIPFNSTLPQGSLSKVTHDQDGEYSKSTVLVSSTASFCFPMCNVNSCSHNVNSCSYNLNSSNDQ